MAKLLTLIEAQERYKVKKETLRQRVKRGSLPGKLDSSSGRAQWMIDQDGADAILLGSADKDGELPLKQRKTLAEIEALQARTVRHQRATVEEFAGTCARLMSEALAEIRKVFRELGLTPEQLAKVNAAYDTAETKLQDMTTSVLREFDERKGAQK